VRVRLGVFVHVCEGVNDNLDKIASALGGKSKHRVVKALKNLGVIVLSSFHTEQLPHTQAMTSASKGRSHAVVTDTDESQTESDPDLDPVDADVEFVSFGGKAGNKTNKKTPQRAQTEKGSRKADMAAFKDHFSSKPPTRMAARVSLDSFRNAKLLTDKVDSVDCFVFARC
jgi:hypothetical protein